MLIVFVFSSAVICLCKIKVLQTNSAQLLGLVSETSPPPHPLLPSGQRLEVCKFLQPWSNGQRKQKVAQSSAKISSPIFLPGRKGGSADRTIQELLEGSQKRATGDKKAPGKRSVALNFNLKKEKKKKTASSLRVGILYLTRRFPSKVGQDLAARERRRVEPQGREKRKTGEGRGFSGRFRKKSAARVLSVESCRLRHQMALPHREPELK